ncbi:MAG: DeoR/GlpR family DNA-binding transcription regulator [Candidatus Limiplasma sp.]|nr:DeoR/GlpR family DNA-binding transcription regulator [Candidatus Limiplasma sp.]
MTDRQSQILNTIADEKRIEVVKLAEMMNVTQVTIRKDLAFLESKGLICRQHGVAMLNAENDVNNRLAFHYERKSEIAARAVELVNNGDVVMIESGSCCALLAEQITQKRKDVTIITNSVFIASYIRPAEGNHMILLGGTLLMEPMVTVGPVAIEAASGFYVDKFFTGTDGITPDGKFTGKNIMQIEVIRTMAKHAKKTVVLTDSSKFFRQGTAALFPMEEVYAVYTDAQCPQTAKEFLEEHQVKVYTGAGC